MDMDAHRENLDLSETRPGSSRWRVATSLARGVAALVDLLPLVLVSGALSLTWVATAAEGGAPSPYNSIDRLVDLVNEAPETVAVPACLLATLFVLWSVLTTWRLGATPGQRLVGLVARTTAGQRVSVRRSLGHAILALITTLLMGLGPLWSLADPERRTLYDRLAGVVLRSER
jgi:hypothetical protein